MTKEKFSATPEILLNTPNNVWWKDVKRTASNKNVKSLGDSNSETQWQDHTDLIQIT